jgi:hypothetical protein
MWIQYGANLIGTEAVWCQAGAPQQYAQAGLATMRIDARPAPLSETAPDLILGAALRAGTYSIGPHPFRADGVMFTTLAIPTDAPAGIYGLVSGLPPTRSAGPKAGPIDPSLVDWVRAMEDGFAWLVRLYPARGQEPKGK